VRDQPEHGQPLLLRQATSLMVTLKVLAALHLRFEDVAMPLDVEAA
jgi:hypothetical protein